jgi:CheY-like chemotaxis protein
VPIIALTAYTSEDEVKKSLEAGMNDYITKPAEKEKLLRIIEKWKQRNE